MRRTTMSEPTTISLLSFLYAPGSYLSEVARTGQPLLIRGLGAGVSLQLAVTELPDEEGEEPADENSYARRRGELEAACNELEYELSTPDQRDLAAVASWVLQAARRYLTPLPPDDDIPF